MRRTVDVRFMPPPASNLWVCKRAIQLVKLFTPDKIERTRT